MGIDSSTPQSSVAILEDGRVLDQAEVGLSSNLPNQVLNLVDTVLVRSKFKLTDLDGLCLTTGPGSFPGLRVGASLLKGLVLAIPNAFVQISTLEANAFRVMPTNKRVCAILDAKKKELYAAFFQSNNKSIKRLTPDRAITPDQLCKEISEPTVFTGNGVQPYHALLSSRLGKNFLPTRKTMPFTVAACAARLAEKNFETNKCFDLSELSIKYVRKPEAELNFMEKESTKGEY